MSNFYTEYDLPIITVRTKFFPRKTNNSFNRLDPIASYHSVDKVARLASKCLRDEKIMAIGHR